MVAACGSSPANTCDLNTAADISTICGGLYHTVYTGTTVHTSAPFTCTGGGSGTMQVDGDVQWTGTFTFDGCTMTTSGDTLTLTGTVTFQADDAAGTYAATSDMLTIAGDIYPCPAPLGDTACAASWGPSSGSGYDQAKGSLCGRRFP